MLAIGLGEKPQEVLTLARCPWFKSFSSQRLGCVCSRLYWYHEQCYVHVTPVRRTRYTLPTMCGAFWVIPGTVGTVTSDTIVYHIGQPGGMQHYGPASKKQIPYCNSSSASGSSSSCSSSRSSSSSTSSSSSSSSGSSSTNVNSSIVVVVVVIVLLLLVVVVVVVVAVIVVVS